ncbi:MAG: tetratricopeptide repeat protein [Flavobacteriales bacterium]|nr:tetratricopeptide repeat protein [Flavobacteriales bacterium]
MRYIALLLATLLLSGSIPASDRSAIDSLQAQAEAAYTKGDVRMALQLYDSLNKELTSASLLFNIGNCHFKLDQVPQAILYYERALLLEPGAPDVRANLELAKQRTMDRITATPTFDMGPAWNRFWSGHDVDSWARRALWTWTAAMLTGILLLWLPRSGPRSGLIAFSAVLALIGACSTYAAWVRMDRAMAPDAGIVMAPRVEVLSEPREGSHVLFVLHAGTKVFLLRSNGAWNEIVLENGTIGWMLERSIERL